MINTKHPHLTNKYGFTLIELVVSFSIIAILSTIGVAAFLNYSRSQTLQQAANDLTVTLNNARSKAVAQIKPSDPGCLPASQQEVVLSGYRIILTKVTTPHSYSLYAVCNGANILVSTTKFPNGVSFDSSMNLPMTITYGVLTGGVVGSGNIVLDGVGVTTRKTINISLGGNITLPTPTP